MLIIVRSAIDGTLEGIGTRRLLKMEISKFTNIYDQAYSEAAALTGKTESELKGMAEKIFATMLFHSVLNRGHLIWTVSIINEGRLDIEVNMRPSQRSTRIG
jgi:hypothetical protein